MKSDKQKAIEAALCALEQSEGAMRAVCRLKAAAERVIMGTEEARFSHAIEVAGAKIISANDALGVALIALKNANEGAEK